MYSSLDKPWTKRVSSISCLTPLSILAARKTPANLTTLSLDDYYSICAWDIVDVLFALVVASLPALNSLIDSSAVRVRAWGSHASSLLRANIKSLGGSSSDDSHNEKLGFSRSA